jgi:hypothetical protein
MGFNSAFKGLISYKEVLKFQLAIDEALGVDLRTHNFPTCNEVTAILLVGIMGAEGDIFHQRYSGLQRINDTQPAFDPLHFLCRSHIVN